MNPSVAGLLSCLLLDQWPNIGVAVGLVAGAAACWLNDRDRAGNGLLCQKHSGRSGSDELTESQARVDPFEVAAFSVKFSVSLVTSPIASIIRASSLAMSSPAG
jgi:hypothetical protein